MPIVSVVVILVLLTVGCVKSEQINIKCCCLFAFLQPSQLFKRSAVSRSLALHQLFSFSKRNFYCVNAAACWVFPHFADFNSSINLSSREINMYVCVHTRLHKPIKSNNIFIQTDNCILKLTHTYIFTRANTPINPCLHSLLSTCTLLIFGCLATCTRHLAAWLTMTIIEKTLPGGRYACHEAYFQSNIYCRCILEFDENILWCSTEVYLIPRFRQRSKQYGKSIMDGDNTLHRCIFYSIKGG